MTNDHKDMYRKLCFFVKEYDEGLISKKDLAEELNYFFLYKLDKTINPYFAKLENHLERIIANGR